MKKLFTVYDLVWYFLLGALASILAIYPDKLFWRVFWPLFIIFMLFIVVKTIIAVDRIEELENEDIKEYMDNS